MEEKVFTEKNKKQRMYKIFILVLLCALSIVWLDKCAIEERVQYAGVCLQTGKVLSDKEKIAIVAEASYKRRMPIIVSDDKGKYLQVPYANVGEFLKKNPDCCKVEMHDSRNPEGGSATDSAYIQEMRKGGSYAGDVHLSYLARYEGDNGEIQTKKITIHSRIGNCGNVNDMWTNLHR